jgi:ribonuclease P protein subunit RPR2
MVRVARERITVLFALAEREAAGGEGALAHRYVILARRIGTRYNVRLLPEYRELYCRGCSEFWVEGRTVRTRLRGGRRVRTCLRCGRARRTRLRAAGSPHGSKPEGGSEGALRDDVVVVLTETDSELPGGPGEEAEED